MRDLAGHSVSGVGKDEYQDCVFGGEHMAHSRMHVLACISRGQLNVAEK